MPIAEQAYEARFLTSQEAAYPLVTALQAELHFLNYFTWLW